MSVNHDIFADFKEFTKNGKLLWTWIAGIAASSSLIALISSLGPPWPEWKAVAYLTALTEACATIFCFVFYLQSNGGMAIKKVEARLFWSMIVVPVAVFFYMSAHALLLLNMGKDGTEAKGWVYTDSALEYKKNNLHESDVDLVKYAGGDVNKVFIPWTVAASRMTLLVLWIAAFYSIVYLLTVFVVTQYRRAKNRPLEVATDAPS